MLRLCSGPQKGQDSVYEWLRVHEDFSEMYARAREARADKLADDMLQIADGDPKSEDTMVKVRRDEQRIKARMWLAARMAPRKWGDRIAHEHGDRDGSPLPRAVIVVRSTADPGKGPKSPGGEEHEGD